LLYKINNFQNYPNDGHNGKTRNEDIHLPVGVFALSLIAPDNLNIPKDIKFEIFLFT
jgi:hypothetical protein